MNYKTDIKFIFTANKMQISVFIIFSLIFNITEAVGQTDLAKNMEIMRTTHQFIDKQNYQKAINILKNETKDNLTNKEAIHLLRYAKEKFKEEKFARYKSDGLFLGRKGDFLKAQICLENAIQLKNDVEAKEWLGFISEFQESQRFFKDKKWKEVIATTKKILSVNSSKSVNLDSHTLAKVERMQVIAKQQYYKNNALKAGLIVLAVFLSIGLYLLIRWFYYIKYILWKKYRDINRKLAKRLKEAGALTEAKCEELKGKLLSCSMKNKLYEHLVKDMVSKIEASYSKDFNFVLYSHKLVDNCYKEIKNLKLEPKKKSQLFAEIMDETSIMMPGE